MKLTAGDILVCIDALDGSLMFYDRPDVRTWKYEKVTREQVLERLTDFLCELEIDAEITR